jgi:integrating conjugative element protein (TIGR03765 family)
MKITFIACLLLIPWNIVAAPLTIIHDSGDTLSIGSYKQNYQNESEPRPKSFADRGDQPIPEFPIETPSMTPDIVDPISISIPYLQVPLFIIGSDTLSKQWLSSRKQELISAGAVGMLIEAISLEEVNAIKRLGKGLQIYPASGRDIAAQLGLKHYPVLISRNGIEQ